MNVFHLPPVRTAVSQEGAGWKKLGIGVMLGFTLKGLITAFLLAITLSEFIHY